MHADGVAEAVRPAVPHVLQQLLLTDRPPLMQQQVFEDARLLARERQRLAAHGRRARLGVKRQLPDTGLQLQNVEGLGEIVVRARIESRHLVGDLAARRQDQHLGVAVTLAQRPEHRHTVLAGEVQIQHDQIKALDGEHLRGALPVIAAVHAVGKPPQAARNRVAERPFIFHNQNMHTILLVRIYECPTLLTLLYDNTKA